MKRKMNETQLHEPMSDWRQPDEGGHDEEDELVHQRAAWEKKREEKVKDENSHKQAVWKELSVSNLNISYSRLNRWDIYVNMQLRGLK